MDRLVIKCGRADEDAIVVRALSDDVGAKRARVAARVIASRQEAKSRARQRALTLREQVKRVQDTDIRALLEALIEAPPATPE